MSIKLIPTAAVKLLLLCVISGCATGISNTNAKSDVDDNVKASAKSAVESASSSGLATSFQAEVYLEQAQASYDFGKYEKATKLSKKAIINTAEKAIEAAQKSGGNTFQAEVYIEQAVASFDMGKYEKAVKLAKKANVSAQASPAKTAIYEIKKNDAATTFQAEVYLEQAEASLKAGKYEKAYKLAKKAVLDPAEDAISKSNEKSTFQAEVYQEQAEAAFSSGNFSKAIKLVKKSTKRAQS